MLHHTFKRLIADSEGNMLMVAAGLMPLIVAAGAVAVDTTQWVLQKRELQRAADSAALTGAMAKFQSMSVDSAVAESMSQHSHITLSGSPGIENGPASGPFAGNATAVRVNLQRRGSVSFVSMFRSDPVLINATATAAATPYPKYCMLSLVEDNTAGFHFEGNVDLNLDCGLATNSNGSPAMTVAGSSGTITTTEVSAVGGLTQYPNFQGSPTFMQGQPAQPDPYKNLPIPPATGCRNAPNGQNLNLTPGCYSGPLDITANANFAPGTYVINGGMLRFGGNGTITGTGVTFILTGPTPASVAKLVIDGGARVTLSAPTSGTYEDVLFYQNRTAPAFTNGTENINTVTGNSNLSISGTMYFPNQQLRYTGGGSLRSSCTRVIARRINFAGQSSAFSGGCTTTDKDLHGKRVRLVA
jgi:Flp pilus assembly protein TadG